MFKESKVLIKKSASTEFPEFSRNLKYFLKIPWVFQIFPECHKKHCFFQVFQVFQVCLNPDNIWCFIQCNKTEIIFFSDSSFLYRGFQVCYKRCPFFSLSFNQQLNRYIRSYFQYYIGILNKKITYLTCITCLTFSSCYWIILDKCKIIEIWPKYHTCIFPTPSTTISPPL